MAGKKTDKRMRVKMHKVMPMVQVSKMGRNRERERMTMTILYLRK